jgi:hypothetical protein
MRITAVAAVAILLFAGCLGLGKQKTDYATVEAAVIEDALVYLSPDHDHTLAALHNGSMNMELVGYHNGVDESGDPNAIAPDAWYTELAVGARNVYLARAAISGVGGFVILNIEDPTAPYLVGSYDALGGSDIEISEDESLAFFSTQRNVHTDIIGNLMANQDPVGAAPRGIHVVDISDKSQPKILFFQPLPVNGPHTLTYHRHADGTELLIACTYDLITDPGTGALLGTVPVTQRMLIYEVVRHDQGASMRAELVPLSQYQILESAPAGRLYFPHDAVVQVHPDNRTYVYLAYWDKGAQILDITNPAQPVHVGSYTDFAPSSRNNIHQVRPFDELIVGKHITVTEPEIVSADETGYIFVLDTTNPADPQRLGYWTLPGELVVNNLDFSPHNFDTWDGKIALAHYHAGVWVLHVGNEANLKAPKAVGYYMPAIERDGGPRNQPQAWGVFEKDGLLYVSDEATGLHIVRYTGP